MKVRPEKTRSWKTIPSLDVVTLQRIGALGLRKDLKSDLVGRGGGVGKKKKVCAKARQWVRGSDLTLPR